MTTKSDDRFWFIAIGLIVPVFVFLYFFFGIFLDPKDSCLDAGGSYNAETKQCEMAGTKPQAENNVQDDKAMPFLSEITYSNLADEASKQEVREALLQAGIDENNIKNFFESVDTYNQTIENLTLNSGFSVSQHLNPIYDEAGMMEKWEAKNPEFIGHNCRITSYNLMRDFIDIKHPEKKDDSQLFMDKDALSQDSQKLFDDNEKQIFESFYSKVNTSASKDIHEHLSQVKQSWNEKWVHFLHHNDPKKASLVSVWFHENFEWEEPYVFIGHIWVLLPTKENTLFFIEKISFTEPYQVLRFHTRTELNDYLMNKYDTAYGQPTASPFIMENGELLEGYRENPNKRIQ